MHDAVMVVRRVSKQSSIVPGGGAIEMELSKYLREHSRTIQGKAQLFMNAFAKVRRRTHAARTWPSSHASERECTCGMRAGARGHPATAVR